MNRGEYEKAELPYGRAHQQKSRGLASSLEKAYDKIQKAIDKTADVFD